MLNPLRTASRKACGWCDAKPTIWRLWQWVIFCRFAHLDFGRTFFSCGHDQPIPCVPSTRVCRLPQLGCSVDRAANSPIAGDVACWPIASTHRSMVVGLPRKSTRLRNCAPYIASSDRGPVSEVLRSLPSSSLDAGFIMAARSGFSCKATISSTVATHTKRHRQIRGRSARLGDRIRRLSEVLPTFLTRTPRVIPG
jgi:hypothetical protein